MGLIIPGFVPSTLHEVVEYLPNLLEWKIMAGIWAFGRNKSAAKSFLEFISSREAAEATTNKSGGYDIPPFASLTDLPTWAEVGPPVGTLYHIKHISAYYKISFGQTIWWRRILVIWEMVEASKVFSFGIKFIKMCIGANPNSPLLVHKYTVHVVFEQALARSSVGMVAFRLLGSGIGPNEAIVRWCPNIIKLIYKWSVNHHTVGRQGFVSYFF